HFGDFTGTASKAQLLGWTTKPFSDWWPHPIFTAPGMWTFASELFASFWRGEFMWARPDNWLQRLRLVLRRFLPRADFDCRHFTPARARQKHQRSAAPRALDSSGLYGRYGHVPRIPIAAVRFWCLH